MKKCVIINCNNKYILKSIIALKQFHSKNPDYNMYIIGTNINIDNKKICELYNIKIKEINLSKDFTNLDKRPYGRQYPIECFYHFYAYKILSDYDFIVLIEPDIYTNKKLGIDFNSIKYIGGGYNNKLIKDFMPLMSDLHKISKVYNNFNVNIPKITGGVKIYNVQNLIKINFYEKIVEYYKKSIEIGAPRCGDDSLMVMYQMLNSNNVTLISPEFHVAGIISHFTDIFHEKIFFFHFMGNVKKYWDNIDESNHLAKYFSDKMIQFAYNNFPINFIRRAIPNLYVDISNTRIPFYYYKNQINFGDLITPYFLKKFCKNKDYFFNFEENNNKKIISCGSLMRLCNKNTIVYGSGIRNIDQDIKPGIIQIVRGPLTRKRLLSVGCYCPPNYGDPGLLLPLYYNPDITKKYKLGIIPHFIHYDKIYSLYNGKEDTIIINLKNENIEEIIDQILSCEKTISSSLHGLIVSDAYNIPNKWIQFDNKIMGDNTKFIDYFKSVNRRDREYIDCMDFKKIPENVFDLIEDVNIKFNKSELKENMFFDENGIKNYTKYLFEKIK